jgi:tRNA CCA-adding enzyme
MNPDKILMDEIALIRVDDEILDKIKRIAGKVMQDLRLKLEKKKIKADVFAGGSLAKNTMIKRVDNKYDVDIFVRFSKEYGDKKISHLLGTIISASKIHGSRDYYQKQVEGITIEIIPVLKIKSPEEAENVTDLSYFHVNCIAGCISRNKKLSDEIRLAKAFAHANDCYGAESYIKGFSGYALELLICHYGSFIKFIKSIANMKENEKLVIDSANFYKNKKEVLIEMNESKINSPIILVDPTFRHRNALAGLSMETFLKFKKACTNFLKNPSLELFERKGVYENFKNLKEARIISVSTNKQKGDIAGTKSKKFFNFFMAQLNKDFITKKSGFDYDDEKNIAYFYLLLNTKGMEIIKGPPIVRVEALTAFKKVHPDAFIKKGYAFVKISHNLDFDSWLKQFLEKNKAILDSMSIKEILVVK